MNPKDLPNASPAKSCASRPPANARVAVVVNGNAKNVNRDVVETLDQLLLGGDLFVSRHKDEGRAIAETLAERGYGTVLTGGGDGTFTFMVTQVVRACRERNIKPPRFGILRLGTGNALAWVTGAAKPKGRGLAADIQRLRREGGAQPLRLIECDGLMAPFCGFGIDGQALIYKESTERWMSKVPVLRRFVPGRLGYIVSTMFGTIPHYTTHADPHCRIINNGGDAYRIGYKGSTVGTPIPRGGVVFEGTCRLAMASTIPYLGYGFRVFPYAEERQDRMHLRVGMIRAHTFLMNMGGMWRGDFYDPNTFLDYLVDDVTIEFEPPTPFQVSGDLHGVREHAHLRLSPEPIELVSFYLPPVG